VGVGILVAGAGYTGVIGVAKVWGDSGSGVDVGARYVGLTVVDDIWVGSKPWPDSSGVPQPTSMRRAISAMDRTRFMSDPLSLNQGLCTVYSSACVERIAAR